MSIYQRVFKVITICLICFGIVEVFGGLFFAGIGSFVIMPQDTGSNAELSQGINKIWYTEVAQHDVDSKALATEMYVFGMATVVAGIISIIAGAFGLRAYRRPKKMAIFTVFNVILFVASFAPIFYAFSKPNVDASLVALSLIPIMMQVLAFVCAMQVRNQLKSGELSDNWYEEAQAKRVEEGKKERIGFLRVIQVWFGLCIVGSLFLCMFLISGSYEVNVQFVVMFVNLVCMGLSFYMIAKRYAIARWWVIGSSSFNILVGTIGVIVAGEATIGERLTTCAVDIFMILYFLLAKTPQRVLVNKISVASVKKDTIEAWDLWRPKTWDFWRAMIIYYCLFSIVGHWMEACYCLTIKYGIMPGTYDPTSGIWRDYLNPFPVYGAGMVACGLLLYPIKTKFQEMFGGLWKPLVCSFVVNSLVCAVIEFVLGMLVNQNLALWNYSDMAFNFMGQICLLNTCLFGVVATLMTWIVYPALQRLYVKMPLDLKKTMFVGIIVFYALVICLYAINL